MRIDLHLHSTASDGSLSPSALMWAARAGGLDIIALSDHDTCDGLEEALRSLPDQLHVIPAIELSTHNDGNEQHILGYFIDHRHESIRRYAEGAVEKRRDRIVRMIDKLATCGIRLSLEDVIANAEPGTRMLGRPHLARALVRRGSVNSVGEAFERFIGDAGPAYLPTQLLTPQEAIRLIHEIGGVAIWAHPRLNAVERYLDSFMAWGIDGVECFRPAATPAEALQLEQVACARSLLVAGGSDWHGTWQGRLGDFYVNHDEVEKLLEVGGI
ncbi:MAG: PHP domain-containing protein [Longimicrobiales bacterium]